MNARLVVRCIGSLLMVLALLIGSWSPILSQTAEAAPSSLVDPVVVDDGNSGFSSSQGWTKVTSGWTRSCTGRNGDARWTYSRYPGYTNDVDWAKWTPNLPQKGKYEVLVFVPGVNNGRQDTQRARYQIHHAKGDKTVTVAQRGNWCGWVSLGTFQFKAGKQGYVYLGDYTGGESPQTGVTADAVKFVYNPDDGKTGLRLPWVAGVSHRVSNDGAGHGAGRHALDFYMVKEPVLAAHDGWVVDIEWQPETGGRVITLCKDKNGNEMCSVYAHLAKKVNVEKGQFVNRGQKIATSDQTGGGTGYHLHFALVSRRWGPEIPAIFDEVGHELREGESPTSDNR